MVFSRVVFPARLTPRMVDDRRRPEPPSPRLQGPDVAVSRFQALDVAGWLLALLPAQIRPRSPRGRSGFPGECPRRSSRRNSTPQPVTNRHDHGHIVLDEQMVIPNPNIFLIRAAISSVSLVVHPGYGFIQQASAGVRRQGRGDLQPPL